MAGERAARVLVRAVAGSLLAVLLVWPVDWAVWRLRVATGEGVGQVVVSRFTIASLKGGKQEYYFDGTGPVDCSRSLFSHGDYETCWSLERSRQLIEQQ